MQDISGQNFGYVIAYLLPGFLLLWALEGCSPLLQTWLGTRPDTTATVGGFLYATLAALAAGLLASTLRWLVVDSLHHASGIRRPSFRFGRLGDRIGAFEYLVESHYRYYQFYGNALVALASTYLMRRLAAAAPPWGWIDVAVLGLASLLWIGSRDALRKYYRRVDDLLSAKPD